MTLSEITYEILLILRAGFVSDDERIDTRLLDTMIKKYRVEYIKERNRINKTIPESLIQETNITLGLVDKTTHNQLESNIPVPKVIVGHYGPIIAEIYSPYVDEYSFTMVNRAQRRYSGNGKFNQRIIYATYTNGKLTFKFKDDGYMITTDVMLSAVFEDPTDVPEFDVDVDDFPIDFDGINYIKDKLFNIDLKLISRDVSDEKNDSDGNLI